jgi:hypothetical protein
MDVAIPTILRIADQNDQMKQATPKEMTLLKDAGWRHKPPGQDTFGEVKPKYRSRELTTRELMARPENDISAETREANKQRAEVYRTMSYKKGIRGESVDQTVRRLLAELNEVAVTDDISKEILPGLAQKKKKVDDNEETTLESFMSDITKLLQEKTSPMLMASDHNPIPPTLDPEFAAKVAGQVGSYRGEIWSAKEGSDPNANSNPNANPQEVANNPDVPTAVRWAMLGNKPLQAAVTASSKEGKGTLDPEDKTQYKDAQYKPELNKTPGYMRFKPEGR